MHYPESRSIKCKKDTESLCPLFYWNYWKKVCVGFCEGWETREPGDTPFEQVEKPEKSQTCGSIISNWTTLWGGTYSYLCATPTSQTCTGTPCEETELLETFAGSGTWLTNPYDQNLQFSCPIIYNQTKNLIPYL